MLNRRIDTDSDEMVRDSDPPLSVGRKWSFSRKILLALTLALLPMGLLAAVLTIGNLRAVRNAEITQIEREAARLARGANGILADYGLVLRTLVVQQAETLQARDDCDAELSRIARNDDTFASLQRVSPSGIALCGSVGGPPPSRAEVLRALETEPSSNPLTSQVFFDRTRRNIVYAVRDDRAEGDTIIALMPVEKLRERFDGLPRPEEARFLVRVAARGAESDLGPASPLQTEEVSEESFGKGIYGVTVPTDLAGLTIRYERALRPFSTAEVAAIAAPIAMWIAALIIAWYAARRLVVLPLMRMRRGIERRSAGEEVKLIPLAGDTQELAAFAHAFDKLSTDQAADRESREAALRAQQRLMREVHHRVKNNLQIVASLLSVQARDVDDDELNRAYGIIQMRVNALALVHRWLFEDDIARGVDFGALAHDLVSNLEASISSVCGVELSIRADIARIFVSQDAAVPLSFLITEIASTAGNLAAAGKPLNLTMKLERKAGQGVLMLECDAFGAADPLSADSQKATARIAHGMARQVRGELRFDPDRRRYRLDFPLTSVVPPGHAAA